MSDISIDENKEEGDEEEYMKKDPIKKYQLGGHDRSSNLSNKYPEEHFIDETKSVQVAPGEGENCEFCFRILALSSHSVIPSVRGQW